MPGMRPESSRPAGVRPPVIAGSTSSPCRSSTGASIASRDRARESGSSAFQRPWNVEVWPGNEVLGLLTEPTPARRISSCTSGCSMNAAMRSSVCWGAEVRSSYRTLRKSLSNPRDARSPDSTTQAQKAPAARSGALRSTGKGPHPTLLHHRNGDVATIAPRCWNDRETMSIRRSRRWTVCEGRRRWLCTGHGSARVRR